MKTEAERRFEQFVATEAACGRPVNVSKYAELLNGFRAIFDPLPPEPEPEPVKSLAQLAYEGSRDARLQSLNEHPWSSLSQKTKDWWTNVANIVIAAHESRRPKPTVDDVAEAIRAAQCSVSLWSGQEAMNQFIARAVFPLFGVEP